VVAVTTEPDAAAVRTELIDRVQRSWDALHAAVDQLDDRQLGAAGPDGWSAKDHLVHLERWEAYLLARLEGGDGRAELGLAAGDERPEEDAINAGLQRRYADLPAADARRRLEETHARMVALLGTLSDADLRRHLAWIAGNTHEHFDEHRGWMAAAG
jgi:hypothetical protein